MISRKQFLKYAALATAGLSLSDKLKITAELEAASLSATGKTLIHVLLEGGPDFLHLIVPKPSSDTQATDISIGTIEQKQLVAAPKSQTLILGLMLTQKTIKNLI
ncbi:MAG: hypothetical protein IPQ05_17380 [Leptospiraceae bacterium]|nr:hypothetical protein [Leptospiraceae bacterium]